MTQDDILEMARSAGLTDGIEMQHEIDAVMRFAVLVAAVEREACAKVCETLGGASSAWHAEAIRARGSKKMSEFKHTAKPVAWRYIRSVDGNVVHDTVEFVQWDQSQLHNTQKHFDVEVIPLYAAPPAVAVPKEYAGVVIWIGETKVVKVVSKEKIIREVVRGMEITNTAQDCLDNLAAAIRARGAT